MQSLGLSGCFDFLNKFRCFFCIFHLKKFGGISAKMWDNLAEICILSTKCGKSDSGDKYTSQGRLGKRNIDGTYGDKCCVCDLRYTGSHKSTDIPVQNGLAILLCQRNEFFLNLGYFCTFLKNILGYYSRSEFPFCYK